MSKHMIRHAAHLGAALLRTDHASLDTLIGAANRIALTPPGCAFRFTDAPQSSRIAVQAGARFRAATLRGMVAAWRHPAAMAAAMAVLCGGALVVLLLACDAAGLLPG